MGSPPSLRVTVTHDDCVTIPSFGCCGGGSVPLRYVARLMSTQDEWMQLIRLSSTVINREPPQPRRLLQRRALSLLKQLFEKSLLHHCLDNVFRKLTDLLIPMACLKSQLADYVWCERQCSVSFLVFVSQA